MCASCGEGEAREKLASLIKLKDTKVASRVEKTRGREGEEKNKSERQRETDFGKKVHFRTKSRMIG